MAALSDPDSETDELERIVSADPGLTLRVLGLANSASGAGQQVRSLRQAIVLSGIEASAAYTLGLLCALVEVMGADPAQAARSARLDDDLAAALVTGQGSAGTLLAAVSSFARTGTSTEPFPPEVLSRAHLSALGSAVATIDAIVGEDQPS